jgi:glycosyltransferase involved in cell wall biosynthesis
VRPGDVHELASALRTLMSDEGMRQRLLSAAPGVLARYSWQRAAAATLDVLLGVAAR